MRDAKNGRTRKKVFIYSGLFLLALGLLLGAYLIPRDTPTDPKSDDTGTKRPAGDGSTDTRAGSGDEPAGPPAKPILALKHPAPQTGKAVTKEFTARALGETWRMPSVSR